MSTQTQHAILLQVSPDCSVDLSKIAFTDPVECTVALISHHRTQRIDTVEACHKYYNPISITNTLIHHVSRDYHPLNSYEVISGRVHLYKISENLQPDQISNDQSQECLTLAFLAVPFHLSTTDFLRAIDLTLDKVSRLQEIRTDPSRYTIIATFHQAQSLLDVYNRLQGSSFDSLEPIYFVRTWPLIIIASNQQYESSPERSTIKKDDSQNQELGRDDDCGSAKLQRSFTELPMCVVCLERLESNATGLDTTSEASCEHLLSLCSSRWHHKRSPCKVCQHCQPGPGKSLKAEETACSCGSTRNLWQCLVCGKHNGSVAHL